MEDNSPCMKGNKKTSSAIPFMGSTCSYLVKFKTGFMRLKQYVVNSLSLLMLIISVFMGLFIAFFGS